MPSYQDGVLGMSLSSGTDVPPVILQMFEKKIISEAKFSFHLTNTEGASYLDFGPIDLRQLRDFNELVYIPVP